MKKVVIVGTNTLYECAKNLYRRGEITLAQLVEMGVRNKNLPEETKKDIVIIK